MRFLRLIYAFIFASIAVLFTLLVLLYYNPVWQREVLLQILEEDVGRQYQVESVQFLYNGLEMENAFVLQGGYGLQIEELKIESPLWKIPFMKIFIDQGEAIGVTLDLSTLRIGDPTALDWQEFLERLRSDEEFWKQRFGQMIQTVSSYGYDVSITDFRINGMVLLPANESIPISLSIEWADSDDLNGMIVDLEGSEYMNTGE